MQHPLITYRTKKTSLARPVKAFHLDHLHRWTLQSFFSFSIIFSYFFIKSSILLAIGLDPHNKTRWYLTLQKKKIFNTEKCFVAYVLVSLQKRSMWKKKSEFHIISVQEKRKKINLLGNLVFQKNSVSSRQIFCAKKKEAHLTKTSKYLGWLGLASQLFLLQLVASIFLEGLHVPILALRAT